MTITLDDVEALGRVLHSAAKKLAEEFPGSLADAALAEVLYTTARRFKGSDIGVLAEALNNGYGQLSAMDDADLFALAFSPDRFLE